MITELRIEPFHADFGVEGLVRDSLDLPTPGFYEVAALPGFRLQIIVRLFRNGLRISF